MIQPVSPEQVREITRTVLRRPEFQEDLTGKWIARALQAVFDWFSKLSRWSAAHPGPAKILIYVLGAVLIVLLVHIASTVIGEFLALRKQRDTDDRQHGAIAALEGVAENRNEAFALARAAVESGDLYRAIWITHRILLSILDLRRLVRFARWKTNNDYLRECPADNRAAATLLEITEAYERVVYAHDTFDRDQAARLVDRVEAFAGEKAP